MGYSLNPYSALELINSTILLPPHEHLVATGLSIVGTTEAGRFETPLFQTSYSATSGRLGWHDFYFSDSLSPVEYSARNCDTLESSGEKMVRAECLLYELNRLSGGRIHLLEFLGDLNASTGVTDNSFIDPKTIGIELVPVLRDSGHFVSCVISHERELTVYFSRRIGTEFEKNKNSSHMIVEQITYRPTPSRRLNKARRHEWNHFNLSHALWEDLKAMNLEDATAFFTPQGEQQLLSFFKWTKLSLMTNPEARKARVAYLQEKHTPDDSAMEIAQSLKNAELYSRNTSLSQIKKYLPKLLSEAFPSDL